MTPESITLWQEKVLPLLTALEQHITIDQLEKLRDEARRDTETPQSIANIIDTLYRLRLEVERL